MAAYSEVGVVTAVCMSPEHGYPTYPQEEVKIGMLGIEGDAHSGSDRESFTNPGTRKPNDRPISIVSEEVYWEINNRFGLSAKPGDFNEQIVVRGLGDLSDVEVGARMFLGEEVVLEVTDNAMPCERLKDHLGEPLIVKSLVFKDGEGKTRTKRGILAKVVQDGLLRPGEDVMIIAGGERPTTSQSV